TLDRAIVAARQTRQDWLLSHALPMASIAANMNGDSVTARRRLDEAGELTPRLDDPVSTLGLIQAQAFNGFFEGDLATVRSVSTEGIRISRETGDIYRLTMMLMNRGNAALFGSDLDESRPFLTEALRFAREIDDRVAALYLLDAVGGHAASSAPAAKAARLMGAAQTIRTGAGARIIPFMTPLLDQAGERATMTLGAARFEAEFKAGPALSRHDAIRLALGEPRRMAG